MCDIRSTAEGVQLLHRNVQRFRGVLVFKAHRLYVSLNSRLGSNTEEEETEGVPFRWKRGQCRARGESAGCAPPPVRKETFTVRFFNNEKSPS